MHPSEGISATPSSGHPQPFWFYICKPVIFKMDAKRIDVPYLKSVQDGRAVVERC